MSQPSRALGPREAGSTGKGVVGDLGRPSPFPLNRALRELSSSLRSHHREGAGGNGSRRTPKATPLACCPCPLGGSGQTTQGVPAGTLRNVAVSRMRPQALSSMLSNPPSGEGHLPPCSAASGPRVPRAVCLGRTFPLDSTCYLVSRDRGPRPYLVLESSESKGSSVAERTEPWPGVRAGSHRSCVPAGTSTPQCHRQPHCPRTDDVRLSPWVLVTPRRGGPADSRAGRLPASRPLKGSRGRTPAVSSRLPARSSARGRLRATCRQTQGERRVLVACARCPRARPFTSFAPRGPDLEAEGWWPVRPGGPTCGSAARAQGAPGSEDVGRGWLSPL